ncbi:MAG TPA: hypothetical protein GX507_01550 [Clostridia bacterium]|nr:hypothetical protein [Clostridia bacterium]
MLLTVRAQRIHRIYTACPHRGRVLRVRYTRAVEVLEVIKVILVARLDEIAGRVEYPPLRKGTSRMS